MVPLEGVRPARSRAGLCLERFYSWSLVLWGRRCCGAALIGLPWSWDALGVKSGIGSDSGKCYQFSCPH